MCHFLTEKTIHERNTGRRSLSERNTRPAFFSRFPVLFGNSLRSEPSPFPGGRGRTLSLLSSENIPMRPTHSSHPDITF
jgi:hypothetical protein